MPRKKKVINRPVPRCFQWMDYEKELEKDGWENLWNRVYAMFCERVDKRIKVKGVALEDAWEHHVVWVNKETKDVQGRMYGNISGPQRTAQKLFLADSEEERVAIMLAAIGRDMDSDRHGFGDMGSLISCVARQVFGCCWEGATRYFLPFYKNYDQELYFESEEGMKNPPSLEPFMDVICERYRQIEKEFTVAGVSEPMPKSFDHWMDNFPDFGPCRR